MDTFDAQTRQEHAGGVSPMLDDGMGATRRKGAMKVNMRRIAVAVAIVGGLAASGALAAHAGLPGAASAAANTTGSTGGVAAADVSATSANGTGGNNATTPGATGGAGPRAGAMPGKGAGKFGFGRGGRGGLGLQVTGVSGDTITATRWGSQAVTVTVSATTAYTEAGQSASLSDVHSGSTILVQPAQNTSRQATTIAAKSITIVLPREAGVVTNVSGDTLTVTSFDGASHTVTVSGATHYDRLGKSVDLSSISTGTAIVAEGAVDSSGVMSAVRITVQVPRVAGQVTDVNGSTITLSSAFGKRGATAATTVTVTTSSATSYVNADGSSATASAVKTGTFIMAQGTLSSDGKTLAAERIVIVPARTGNTGGMPGRGGIGGHGRFGPRGDGTAGGSQGWGSTAPGSGSTPSTTAPQTGANANV